MENTLNDKPTRAPTRRAAAVAFLHAHPDRQFLIQDILNELPDSGDRRKAANVLRIQLAKERDILVHRDGLFCYYQSARFKGKASRQTGGTDARTNILVVEHGAFVNPEDRKIFEDHGFILIEIKEGSRIYSPF